MKRAHVLRLLFISISGPAGLWILNQNCECDETLTLALESYCTWIFQKTSATSSERYCPLARATWSQPASFWLCSGKNPFKYSYLSILASKLEARSSDWPDNATCWIWKQLHARNLRAQELWRSFGQSEKRSRKGEYAPRSTCSSRR